MSHVFDFWGSVAPCPTINRLASVYSASRQALPCYLFFMTDAQLGKEVQRQTEFTPTLLIQVKLLQKDAIHPVQVRGDEAVPILLRDLQTEASYPLAFLMQFAGIFFSVFIFYFLSQLVGDSVAKQIQVGDGE